MEREMTGLELATRTSEGTKVTDLGCQGATTPWMMRIEEHACWKTLEQVQVTIRACVEISHFRVGDLLTLKKGQVFTSLAPAAEDVSVRVGHVQLGWSEFEVLDQKMALRLTRLG
jgi:flagellar motor switch/type III secretory pathway protein FliN